MRHPFIIALSRVRVFLRPSVRPSFPPPFLPPPLSLSLPLSLLPDRPHACTPTRLRSLPPSLSPSLPDPPRCFLRSLPRCKIFRGIRTRNLDKWLANYMLSIFVELGLQRFAKKVPAELFLVKHAILVDI